jgi:membrane-associated protease RseP (regulator of RpoE activity)
MARSRASARDIRPPEPVAPHSAAFRADHSPVSSMLLFVPVLVVVERIGVLVHELGHALTAQRLGARVTQIYIGGSGRAWTFRIAGFWVRLGLSLHGQPERDEPGGWAGIAFNELDPDGAIRVLRTGPLAHLAYALAVILLALVAPVGGAVTTPLTISGASVACNALHNLRPNGPPSRDGVRIAAIRSWQTLIRCGVAAPRPTRELLVAPVAG